MQRNIKNTRNGEVGLESNQYEGWFLGFDHEGQDVFIKEFKVVLEDCMVPNIEEERSNVFVIYMNMQITNKDMTILEKTYNVPLKETIERLPLLRRIENQRLYEVTRKVDEFMINIQVGNITEMNRLVYIGALVVSEILGVKNRKGTKLNTDLGHIINTLIESEKIKKKNKNGLERRYKMK